MLLAHLAICEVFWVEVVGQEIESEAVGDRIVREIVGLGIEDDGMPLAKDGAHPSSLAGQSAGDYLERLEWARAATHRTLRSWTDLDLETTRRVDGREVTLAWLLHHIVEHFSHHAGQIAQIASLRRLVEGEAPVRLPHAPALPDPVRGRRLLTEEILDEAKGAGRE